MPLLWVALTIGLVLSAVAAFRGRPEGALAIGFIGLIEFAVASGGRIHIADMWVAVGSLAAGACGVAVRLLRGRSGNGPEVARQLLSFLAGAIGLVLALLGAGLTWFASGGLS